MLAVSRPAGLWLPVFGPYLFNNVLSSLPHLFLTMTADQLQAIISAGLPCDHLSIEGDGRHWFATIVSSAFDGQRAVQRQRLVYATLGERIHNDEVHALSMKTFTPAEWAMAQTA